MSFAPSTTLFVDVFIEYKDGKRRQVGYGVDQFEAERLAFHSDKPRGARFVCKVRR